MFIFRKTGCLGPSVEGFNSFEIGNTLGQGSTYQEGKIHFSLLSWENEYKNIREIVGQFLPMVDAEVFSYAMRTLICW